MKFGGLIVPRLQNFNEFMTRTDARFDDDAGFRNMKMLGKDFDEGDIRRAIDWLFAEVDGEIFCGCGLSGVHGGGLDDERPLL